MSNVINLYGPSKEKEGAGVWWTMRMLAETRNACFPQVVYAVVNNFYCEDCKQHARQFLAKNPIPNDAYDWFAWMVKWQNAVNHRTGKHIYTIDEARAIMDSGKNQQKAVKMAGHYWGQEPHTSSGSTQTNVIGCSDCTVNGGKSSSYKSPYV